MNEEVIAPEQSGLAVGSSSAPEGSGPVVGFSQRITEASTNFGLQPHSLKMRLKPVLQFSILVRQLPACRIGRKLTACPDSSGAIRLKA